jgi:hypothetical protein
MECSSCGAPYEVERIDLSRGVVECAACGTLSAISVVREGPDLPAPKPRDLPMPKAVMLMPRANGLLITRRWFTPALFFLLFFCIAWDAFLVFWYSMAISSFGSAGGASWIMVVFPIGHLAVGVGLTYFVIAGFLNRTEIHVDYETLIVRHRPVPWFGNRMLPVEQVSQLYVEEKIAHGKNGTSVSYLLNLETVDGRKVKIVRCEEREQALYIEQEIERFLDISDEAVEGEYRASG